MAIYYYPVPLAQPAPATVAGDNYFGSQDVYVNQNGAVRNGQLGTGLSAGKITLVTYDATKSYLGLTGGTFTGLTTPPTAPPIIATVLASSVTINSGTLANVNPITAYGGSAIANSILNISVSPALPAGLTIYKSKINLNVSGPAPIVTGSGTTWNVTYTIASSTGNAPTVGSFYAVRGQTKTSYNGIWQCVATTGSTITLRYYATPAASGGTTPPGQVSWNTAATVTITESGQVAVPNTSTGVYFWYNSVDFVIIGTPTFGSPTTNYVVTYTDSSGQTGSASFTLTINGPAVFTTTQAIASRTLTVNTLATSFTPVTASGGTTPYTFAITPSLPPGLNFSTTTGQVSGTPTALSPVTTYTVTVTDNASNTSSKTFTLSVVAPALTTTLVNSSVTLTETVLLAPFTPVTASGGAPTLTYSISPSLPTGLNFNTVSGQITGTPTGPMAATSYTVTVTDSVAQTSSKTFSLTINALPTLNSTLLVPASSLTNNLAVTAFIPVSGSGGYGTLTYAISPVLPAGLTFSTSNGQISGTPTILSAVDTYSVTITDQAGQITSKSFTLEVLPGALTTTQVIATKTLVRNAVATAFTPVTASGGEGTKTFSISPILPSGLNFSNSTGQISGTPTALSALTTYTVTVTDTLAQTSSKTFTLEVVNPAALTTIGITSKTLTQNQAAVPFIPVTGSGGYGTLTYAISPAIPSGLTFNASTGQVSGTPTIYLAPTNFTVTVSDQATQTSSKTFSLTIITQVLVATKSIPSKTLTQGASAAAFTPITSSGGLAPYTFSISPVLPDGLTFNTTNGSISGTPITLSPSTVYTVTINDSLSQVASNTFNLDVVAPPALTTTQVTATSTFYRNIDVVNITPVTASGGFGTITFAITPSLPDGLTFNTTNGKITGTGTVLSNQNYTITATDSLGQTSSKTYQLILTDPPLVTTLAIPSTTLTRSKPFTAFTPVTGTGGASPISYSISPSLPSGLTFNVTNGAISSSPSPAASQPSTNYAITVTDSLGATSSKTFSLTINEPAALVTTVNTPTVNLPVNTTATSFIPVSATGGDGTITYGISPSLPSGLTFDINTGRISGKPLVITGATTFTVTATDSISQTSSKTFSLTISALPLVTTVNNSTLVYTIYSVITAVIPVSATGGTGALTYSISPSLPSGLSFNTTNGQLTGTPTQLLGLTTYTVTVTDTVFVTTSNTFTLAVDDVPPPPLTAFSASSNVTAYLNGTTSEQPITGSGGLGTYTFSISPTLPAGLSFDGATGIISGSATVTLSATVFTVTIIDQVPQTASAQFTLQVIEYIPPPGTGVSGASGKSGYSGRSGYSGVTGADGASGYSGVTGADGVSGFSGMAGAYSASGFSGDSGYSGNSGLSGYSGIGLSGYSGEIGVQGISGFSGQAGAFSASGYSGVGGSGFSGTQGDVAGLTYQFNNNTYMTDPTQGYLKYNSSTITSVTQIAIDNLTYNGAKVDPYINTWDDNPNPIKGTLIIRSNTNTDDTYNIFNLTSATEYAGSVSYSVVFDGNGDYLVTAASNQLFLANNVDWTVELFVNSSASATQCLLFSSDGTTNFWNTGNNISFNLNSSNKVVINYSDNNTSPQTYTGTLTVNTNSWNHLAFVYDSIGQTLTTYVNGLVDLNAVSFASYNPQATIPRFTVGRTDTVVPVGSANFFTGTIANVRVVFSQLYTGSIIAVPTSQLTSIANTKLLTAQSSTFVDNGPYNFSVTANGNAAVNGANPFSYSIYFDGSGDMVTVSSLPGPLTGDFTYEAWVYPTSSAVSYRVIFGIDNYAGGQPFRLYQYGTNFQFWYTENAGNFINSNTIIVNEWYHLAATRSGSSLKFFVNGTQVGSTITNTANYPTSNFRIGMDSAGSYPFIGYISNVRVVNGTAVYTSNFAPPVSQLPVISGTTLLTANSSRFKDYSLNNYTVTASGNANITTQTPFNIDQGFTVLNVGYVAGTIPTNNEIVALQFYSIGNSGYSGQGGSGYSGISGYSGTIGQSGYSGSIGISGFSGISGNSTSGYSGLSGYSSLSGYSGLSGLSGYSGTGGSGYSGTSGWSGTSGYSGQGLSGFSGLSGYSGTGASGFSGVSGFSGAAFVGSSGYSGLNGIGSSGYSGQVGTSGWSGYSGLGLSGYSGVGLSGFSGALGLSGFSGQPGGLSGYSGTGGSGFSGISGYSGLSGLTVSIVKYNIYGNIEINTGTVRWYPESNVTLNQTYFNLGVAGTSTTEVDIKKNNISIVGTKPSVGSGVFRSNNFSLSTSMTTSDFLTFDVTLAGTGAQNAVIYVVYTKN